MRLRHKDKTQPPTSLAGETLDSENAEELEPDELEEPDEEPAPVSYTLPLGSGGTSRITWDRETSAAAFCAGMPRL